MYLLDKFGVMRKLEIVNEKRIIEHACMENCVDFFSDNVDLILMDADGHVRYQETNLFGGRRRREVAKWNTRY